MVKIDKKYFCKNLTDVNNLITNLVCDLPLLRYYCSEHKKQIPHAFLKPFEFEKGYNLFIYPNGIVNKNSDTYFYEIWY